MRKNVLYFSIYSLLSFIVPIVFLLNLHSYLFIFCFLFVFLNIIIFYTSFFSFQFEPRILHSYYYAKIFFDKARIYFYINEDILLYPIEDINNLKKLKKTFIFDKNDALLNLKHPIESVREYCRKKIKS